MRKYPTVEPRICKMCGEIYVPTGNNQQYCEKCKKIRKRETGLAYFYRQNPNAKPKVKCTEPCCICGAPFSAHFDGKPYCNKHYLRMLNNGTPELVGRKRTNAYFSRGDMLEIMTADGHLILADSSKRSQIERHSWCISKTGYAVANIGGKTVKMHRYLLGVNDDPDILIDHINGNTLDNRMCNLRICNQTENARNRRASRTNRLGILGISVMPNGRYKATIVADRIPHSLGTFDTLELAIQARHEAEIRYHGEFASHISRSKDDAQVSRLEVRKRYGEEPRVEVRLEEIKNEQQ